MSMRSHLGTFSLGCFLLVGSSSWAATLEPVRGDLWINQGQGFQPVNGPVDANIGDSIMVSPGGAAMVVYADGCRDNVQPGEVTTITQSSPCTNPFAHDRSVAQEPLSSNYNLAIGATAGLEQDEFGLNRFGIPKSVGF